MDRWRWVHAVVVARTKTGRFGRWWDMRHGKFVAAATATTAAHFAGSHVERASFSLSFAHRAGSLGRWRCPLDWRMRWTGWRRMMMATLTNAAGVCRRRFHAIVVGVVIIAVVVIVVIIWGR